MVRKQEQDRMRVMLCEAINVLCKASLTYRCEFSVEGLIGVTIDNEEIFLININETIKNPDVVLNLAKKGNSPVAMYNVLIYVYMSGKCSTQIHNPVHTSHSSTASVYRVRTTFDMDILLDP